MTGATAVRTLGDLTTTYARSGSARVLGLATGFALVARAVHGRPTRGDALSVAVGVGVAPFVEWAVHRHLFHAPEESARRQIGFGSGHARHHDDPDDLDWLFLPTGGAAALVAAAAVPAASWSVLAAATTGTGTVPAVLTGLATACSRLARYEWIHLVSHSRRRPRTGRGRRLVANHLRHHHRDPGRWFGVTSTLGDRLFGTA